MHWKTFHEDPFCTGFKRNHLCFAASWNTGGRIIINIIVFDRICVKIKGNPVRSPAINFSHVNPMVSMYPRFVKTANMRVIKNPAKPKDKQRYSPMLMVCAKKRGGAAVPMGLISEKTASVIMPVRKPSLMPNKYPDRNNVAVISSIFGIVTRENPSVTPKAINILI
jgi:hypothetical protein